MSNQDPAVIGIVEAGRLLGLGKTKTYELVAAGEFPVPVLTIGRRQKVSRRQLFAFIEGDQAVAS